MPLFDAPIPAGSILDYAGATAPGGWLLCDGSSLLRADYPDLFAVIGTTYGAVDGTHFTLPDCRGRMTVGKGTHADIDALGDADALTLANRTPNHTHGVGTYATVASGSTVAATPLLGNASASGHTHAITGASASSSGGGYIALNKIVKV